MSEYDYDGDSDREPREDEEWGCIFPGKCCMPGEHRKGECHTAEMIEAFNAEMEALATPPPTGADGEGEGRE
jgi:hypothetical protein